MEHHQPSDDCMQLMLLTGKGPQLDALLEKFLKGNLIERVLAFID